MQLILPLILAGIVGGGCRTYEIDGNQVKKSPLTINNIVENKGDTLETKYTLHILGNGLKNIEINGKKYNFEDRDVYLKELNHYWYLIDKIDSIKVEDTLKTQKEKEYGIKRL